MDKGSLTDPIESREFLKVEIANKGISIVGLKSENQSVRTNEV